MRLLSGVVILVAVAATMAAVILSQTTNVTVQESVSVEFASPDVSIFPNQTITNFAVLTNVSPYDVNVTVGAELTGPIPGAPSGVTVSIVPNTVTIPGNSAYEVGVVIAASNGVDVGPYTVQLSIVRQ